MLPINGQLRPSNSSFAIGHQGGSILSYAASDCRFAGCPRKLLDELALARSDVLRQSGVDLDLQVPAPIWLAEVRHTLAAQPEQLAVLRTGRDLERQALAGRGWNLDLAT